jgi:predicted ATPase/Flp pilus assembly protein TadD
LRKLETGERRASVQVAELLANGLELPPEARPMFVKVARGFLGVERLPPPLPGDPPGHPVPVPVPVVPRVNLPVHATPLIGRQAELAELGRLLSDPTCRVITLTGPGGVGKTRLAISAAREAAESFSDGVALVPLAPLTLASFLIPAIAEAIGFSFSGPAQPQTQLGHYLRDKHLLLVLDNVEHLLADGAAEHLAALSEQASGVVLLVTSREVVGLQAECVFEVQGLPVPAELPCAVEAAGSAVELFVQRARRAHVSFSLEAADYPAVLRICQLVEGLPLAVELAASWVRVLDCREIAAELAHSLDLISAPTRDVPVRHRSMRAVFDHSWDLLSGEEQGVLQRLSVFRGGFSREAAEHVAGASIGLLASLVSKSLVQRAPDARYDLHELLREYASARLTADPDMGAAAYAEHSAFFLALAEAAEPHLKGPQQVAWLDRLEQDYDNLRAVLEWSLTRETATTDGIGEMAQRLAIALRWFWHIRGYFHEGHGWLTRALRLCPPEWTAVRARVLEAMAILIIPVGDHAAGLELAKESGALFRELDERQGLADALTEEGDALVWLGEGALGQSRLEEALALYRELDDKWGMARDLYHLGTFRASLRGDVGGRAMLEESLAYLDELGDQYRYTVVLISLGILAGGKGDYHLARAHFHRVVDLSRELRQPWTTADALTNLGIVLSLQGDYAAAQSHFEEAFRIYQERGSPVWSTDPLCALTENAIRQGDLPAARSWLHDATARSASSGIRWLHVLVGHFSGLLAYYEGQLERAATMLEETAALAREHQFMPDLARSLVALGRVRHAQGDLHRATARLQEGLRLFQQMNHKLGAVTALEALAELALGTDAQNAARLLGAAEAFRSAMGTPLPPVDRPAHGQALAALHARLDERTLAALRAEGHAMDWDTAVATGLQGSWPNTAALQEAR